MNTEELKMFALAASPGPWEWWTSNGTKRLTSNRGQDGGVLCATHGTGTMADIVVAPANMEYIEAANPAAVLELISELSACVALAQSMLSPEQFGHAVTAEVRDAARKALGRQPTEQAQYLNVPADRVRGVTEMVAEAKPVAGKRICWSADEENYNCDSLGELLDSNDGLAPGHVVYFAEAILPGPKQLCDADAVADIMTDRAYDIAGEHADGFPSVTAEARSELNDLLAGWINRNCTIDFWTVNNSKPYTLTAADFEGDATIALQAGEQS